MSAPAQYAVDMASKAPSGLRESTAARVRRNEYRHQLNLITEAVTVAHAQGMAFAALTNPDLGGTDLSLEEIHYRGVLRRVLNREGGCYALIGMHSAATQALTLHGPRRRVLESPMTGPGARRPKPAPQAGGGPGAGKTLS